MMETVGCSYVYTGRVHGLHGCEPTQATELNLAEEDRQRKLTGEEEGYEEDDEAWPANVWYE